MSFAVSLAQYVVDSYRELILLERCRKSVALPGQWIQTSELTLATDISNWNSIGKEPAHVRAEGSVNRIGNYSLVTRSQLRNREIASNGISERQKPEERAKRIDTDTRHAKRVSDLIRTNDYFTLRIRAVDDASRLEKPLSWCAWVWNSA